MHLRMLTKEIHDILFYVLTNKNHDILLRMFLQKVGHLKGTLVGLGFGHPEGHPRW